MCAYIGKAHEFLIALKKAGLTDLAIQEVINSKDNLLAKKMIDALNGLCRKSILNLVSGGQKVFIKEITDGKLSFYEIKGIFNKKPNYNRIDESFVPENGSYFGVATPETLVRIDIPIKTGTYADMALSLPGKWNQKWLTRKQVLEVYIKPPSWLSNERRLIFFIKKEEKESVDENNPADNLEIAELINYEDYKYGGRNIYVRPILDSFTNLSCHLVSPKIVQI